MNMGYDNPSAGNRSGNLIPASLVFHPGGITLAAELYVRGEHGDVVIDLATPGHPAFTSAVLTTAHALDLCLRMIGCVARLRPGDPT
jgi:hypothetical protein